MSPNDDCPESMLAPIMALHRHNDGYISFAVARDAGEDFRPVVSIRRDELARYFPEFRAQLLKDSYVSINADWRLRRQGPHGAAYGVPLHRTDRLRYLCAAYADLDYYRLGVTWGQALGRVVEMQDAGYLPKASMIVKSGRGMWLLYLLHDHRDPSRAPGAFPEKLEQYFALQRAIVERLAPIGADAGARDAARHIRVPGSLHTGSEATVQWWIQGEGKAAYSYSLSQLCDLFGVSLPLRHAKERRAIASEENKPKRKGWAALNARRLKEFNLLRARRGGFLKGTRNRAALLYSWLLRLNGVPRPEAAVSLMLFGAECHPRLMRHESVDAIKSGFAPRFRRILDSTIADWLDVTPEEVDELNLKLPPAARFRQIEAPPLMPAESRGKNIMERRAKITEVIAELGGKVPTLREMGRLLVDAGFPGSVRTLLLDYQALGVESGRTRAARAESAQRYAELQPGLFKTTI